MGWHYLNKEFAQRRPTEKLALITSYRKPPRQAPGQSVTSYFLGCKKYFERLESVTPDAAKRWVPSYRRHVERQAEIAEQRKAEGLEWKKMRARW